MEHLIIGGGPAGMAAAACVRRLDASGRITVLSKEKVNPYAKMALPYRLSGEADDKQILLPVPEGVSLLLGREVARIEPLAAVSRRRRVRRSRTTGSSSQPAPCLKGRALRAPICPLSLPSGTLRTCSG